jgi:hypothetical protein
VDYIQLDPRRDLLEQWINESVLQHSHSEVDENLKLRIALILAVRLLQDEDDMVAVDFCNTMLIDFQPLARHFEPDNEHTLCGGYKCLRVKDANDNIKVAIPTEFIEFVGGRHLERSSDQPEGDGT